MAWGKTKGLRISGTPCLPYQHAGTLVLNSRLTSTSLLLAGREMMGWNRAAAPQGLRREGTLTAHYSQLLVQTSGGKSCWTSNLYCGQNDSLAIPRKPQNPTATFPVLLLVLQRAQQIRANILRANSPNSGLPVSTKASTNISWAIQQLSLSFTEKERGLAFPTKQGTSYLVHKILQLIIFVADMQLVLFNSPSCLIARSCPKLVHLVFSPVVHLPSQKLLLAGCSGQHWSILQGSLMSSPSPYASFPLFLPLATQQFSC